MCPIDSNVPGDALLDRGPRLRESSEPQRRRDAAVSEAIDCDAAERVGHQRLIDRKGGSSVFVSSAAWAGLSREARVEFATWAAACLLAGPRVTVRHTTTGRVLAVYARDSGYKQIE